MGDAVVRGELRKDELIRSDGQPASSFPSHVGLCGSHRRRLFDENDVSDIVRGSMASSLRCVPG